jgi:hypothetical protein
MPSPLRNFSTKEEGLHVPRTKPSSLLHTKPEGWRLAGEPPKTTRGQHTKIQLVVHSRTSTQGSNALLSHSL